MTETKKEYWATWAKKAGIRAVKTVAQTAVATIGTAVWLVSQKHQKKLNKGGKCYERNRGKIQLEWHAHTV